MPYREDNKWRAVVKCQKKRYQAVFEKKSDALKWEVRKRGEIKRHSRSKPTGNPYRKIPVNDLDEFIEKYQEIYKDPRNTIADIFDMMMKDVNLPVTFKDVLELKKKASKNKGDRISATLRAEILKRDNFTCQWCGSKSPEVKLHVDHIIPKARGGLTEKRNLQALCHKCNYGKHDRPFIIENQNTSVPQTVPQ